MDKFDQLILQQLQQDARQAVAQIAETIGLSRSAVSDRIKRMEDKGIIAGYRVVLAQDPQASVCAYLEVQHQAARCADLIPWLQQFPEIKRCQGISGEIDLLLYVEAATMSRLHTIREALDAQPDIRRVRTHMVLSHWIG